MLTRYKSSKNTTSLYFTSRERESSTWTSNWESFPLVPGLSKVSLYQTPSYHLIQNPGCCREDQRLQSEHDELLINHFSKWLFKRNALIMTQVLVEWLMDQVPLGNKTPRPGLPRLVHCPACRGLLPYPQALDSGHVLLECFAIEGTKPELASVFLKTIQVQEFVKESEPSLRTAEDWERARRQPTPSLSRDWIQVEPRCQSETTWREELHFLLWPACGFIPGVKKKMS